MSSPKRLPQLSKMSAKQKAKRAGEKFIFSTIVPKPKKPIRAVNPEAEARRKKSYAKKLGGYKRSETFKVVQERAAGQCEFEITMHVRPWYLGTGSATVAEKVRCPETEGLQHHHKRYGKQFGGNERPEDIIVVCKAHHDWLESQHPTRKR